ncbi:beta/gamma crystallin domain-containing protein [Streptomyces sp. NPDC001515]
MVKAALVSAVAAASLIVVPNPAFAIDSVECYNIDEYTHLHWHHDYGSGFTAFHQCFANAGEYSNFRPGGTNWVDKIWTGNNRVQWYGDGKWQPATPIDKWTTFTWPNHPGGVRIDAIRIV